LDWLGFFRIFKRSIRSFTAENYCVSDGESLFLSSHSFNLNDKAFSTALFLFSPGNLILIIDVNPGKHLELAPLQLSHLASINAASSSWILPLGTGPSDCYSIGFFIRFFRCFAENHIK